MKFPCTNSTLKTLSSYDGAAVKLEDILAVIQDVLKDAADESGKKVYELDASPNAVQFWLAVSRAFLQMDMSSANEELSDRQRSRLADVRQSLEGMAAEITKAETDMNRSFAEEEELKKQLEPLYEARRKREEAEARVRVLRNEIERIQRDIERASDIDPAALEAKKDELLSVHNANVEKVKELNDITTSLAAEEERKRELDEKVSEAKKKLMGAQDRYVEKNDLLTSINEEYERKMTELSEQLAKINADNDLHERELSQKQTELNAKKTINSGFSANLADIMSGIKKLSDENLMLADQIQKYEAELSEKKLDRDARAKSRDDEKAKVDALSAEIEELNGEISRLGEQRKALIEENNNKRIMLKNNDPEALQKEIEEMDIRLSEYKRKCEELEAQKLTLAENEKKLIEAQENTASEIEQLTEKIKLSEEQASEHDKTLKELTERNEGYQKLFDSDKYRDEARKTESLRKAANIYANGVEKLLSYMNEQAADAPDLDANIRLGEARTLLETQMKEAEAALGKLRSGYISIIEKTENEVNQNAM